MQFILELLKKCSTEMADTMNETTSKYIKTLNARDICQWSYQKVSIHQVVA